MTHTLKIQNGCVTFIYHDDLVDLIDAGESLTWRVSNVEPGVGGWYVAMCDEEPDRDRPALGPYRLREEALTAEREYLREHAGL